MTTRKASRDRPRPAGLRRGPSGARRIAAALLAGVALGAAGCATKGQLHVYAVTAGPARPVLDLGPDGAREHPSFLAPGDGVSGFAYDPFTDHFFLRLAPGNRVRVVDRPARAVKREFTIEGAPAGAGDLAVRPRDGHLFLLGARPGQILEATRLGRYVGEFTLAGTGGPVIGLAFDAAQDLLLALAADGRRLTVHDRRGSLRREVQLDQAADPALAFDADAREFHAPLRARPGAIGVFAEDGRLLRTAPVPHAAGLIDVGPRSFLRVF